MGRGRNRKPRNFATFRLCPRPGAADASDRVFVRVDDNSYSVPGFADDEGPSSHTAVAGDGEPSDDDGGGGALPDHVRREILELGLPDDGYDYLSHLRELRPSLSPFGGGGSSAVFLPSRRPARSGLRADVKAYDLSGASAGCGEVAVVAASRAEEAIDLDVAKLLDGSDLPVVESGGEDLEEDFVFLANQADQEQKVEEEESVARGKEKSLQLPREQFDSLDLEEYADERDGCNVKDVEHELSHEVLRKLKPPHSENFGADKKQKDPQYLAQRTLESTEHIVASSTAIFERAGHAERYELREEEQATLVPEISNRSVATNSATMVSGSYLDVKKKFPKFPPGETSMKKSIIRKGVEKLPAGYLPQRTSSGETLKQGPYEEPKEEGRES
ncbi:hypothetical protein BS78_02G362900 [Paspalum vaginatum]|nr:hypothetical protein BS78_02G362900 [Paspalum vaginatum]KAJ1292058.1 hypothetical protein BS78_02G362900 [Paspalum vaginatum]